MKKLLTILLLFISAGAFCQAGGMSISPNGAAPDPSAGLDVNFNDKGLLMPRISQAQRDAIVNPANGLFIYNTDCNVVNFNAGTSASPNWVTLNSSNALIAGVSIFASPSGGICAGTNVSFTAVPSGGINSPNYQWQVNGGNIGNNSDTYSSSSLNNGDVVTCVLSSNAPCVSGSPATSNPIVINVITTPSTPGAISGSTVLCPDSTDNVYSITPVAEATSYNWTVPGDATITAGAGTNSITVTFGLSSGNISVSASNACGTSSSNSLAVTVNPAIPSTPGNITGSISVDTGSSGNIYSISPVNNASTYTWTVPAGATITAGQGTPSITVTFGIDSGNISVKAGNSCGTSSANSVAVSVVSCGGYGNGSQTFNYTGGAQTFTVPGCVSSVTIKAYGAQGSNSGGWGGSAQGTIVVAPGSILYVYAGGQSGFNGGGTGGSAANGGGMSDVRMGGTSFANTIIVAGGGGGSFPPNGTGGAGGAGNACGNGAGGGAGQAYVYENTGYSGPGYSGSCTNGGAGGNGYGGFAGGGGGGGLTGGGGGGSAGNYGNNGQSGSSGQGGNYGSNDINVCVPYAGGGGGGGYYGGGGGANAQCQAGGGGGGSSWASASMTNISFSSGVQSGNGQVVITW